MLLKEDRLQSLTSKLGDRTQAQEKERVKLVDYIENCRQFLGLDVKTTTRGDFLLQFTHLVGISFNTLFQMKPIVGLF